jgi:integrase
MEDDFEFWDKNFTYSSKARHKKTMRMFLESGEDNLTHNDLLIEAKNDIKSDKTPMQYSYIRRIDKFKDYLNKQISEKTGKPLSHGTIRTYFNDIISFYEFHSYSVPKGIRKIQYEETDRKVETHKDVDLDKSIITEMLDKSDELEKALILGQASSGMSNADLLNLTIEQFKNGRHHTGITVLKDVRRQKTRNKTSVKYITFFSREATEAIDAYLEFRVTPPSHKTVESLDAFEKRKITSDKNYLFAKRRIVEPHPKKTKLLYEKTQKDSDYYRKLSPDSIHKMYNRLYPSIRGHLLRKYFSNALTKNGVQKEYAETMMGHTLGGSRDYYHLPSIDKLIEAYMKCEADLTFTNKELLKEAEDRNLKEIERLKKELKEQKEEGDKRDREIQAIKKRMGFINKVEGSDLPQERKDLYIKVTKEQNKRDLGLPYKKLWKPDEQDKATS